jgi:hypothetical protein
MPRPTSKQANKREAIDPRTTFRLTTPSLKVAARPVDTSVRHYNNETDKFVKSLNSTMQSVAGVADSYNRQYESDERKRKVKNAEQGELDAFTGKYDENGTPEYDKSYNAALGSKAVAGYNGELNELVYRAKDDITFTPDMFEAEKAKLQEKFLAQNENPYYQMTFAKGTMGLDAVADSTYLNNFRDGMRTENFTNLNAGLKVKLGAMLDQNTTPEVIASVVESYQTQAKTLGISSNKVVESVLNMVGQRAFETRNTELLNVLDYRNGKGVALSDIEGGDRMVMRWQDAIEDAIEFDRREVVKQRSEYSASHTLKVHEGLVEADKLFGKQKTDALQSILSDVLSEKDNLDPNYFVRATSNLRSLISGGGYSFNTNENVYRELQDAMQNYKGDSTQLENAFKTSQWFLTREDARSMYSQIQGRIGRYAEAMRTEEGRKSKRWFDNSESVLFVDIDTSMIAPIGAQKIKKQRSGMYNSWYLERIENGEFPTREECEQQAKLYREMFPTNQAFSNNKPSDGKGSHLSYQTSKK